MGVPGYRLESPDVVSLGFGLYAHVQADLRWPRGRPAPGHGLGPAALAALLRSYPASVASHATAAHCWRLPVPAALEREHRIHVTRFDGKGPAQRRGIVAHRSPLGTPDRTMLLGVPVTTAARTWVDLAADPRLDDSDLVVLADAIVNRPWVRGHRVDGLDTTTGLAEPLGRAGSVKGVGRARAALARARVGADSPPETRARLALVDAGLPEPGVQVPADPADPYTPVADLGYRDLRMAIQYDGSHHRTAQQQAADAYRDDRFRQLGWTVIRLTWLDLRQGFVRLVRRVRERLEHGR